jgi:ribosomal protein S18 acetylase RimI-like enzyme
MIDIRPLTQISADELRRVITGYISPARYRVLKSESEQLTTFSLELVQLQTPYIKRDDFFPDEEDVQRCLDASEQGRSLGAYEDDHLIAVALAEAATWSNRLWLHEFHVAEAYRGKGIGTRLMNALIALGQQAGFRALFCETQTTNVPAIRFYRKMGFTLEGIDLSLYTNHDYPDSEIALFFARNLQD